MLRTAAGVVVPLPLAGVGFRSRVPSVAVGMVVAVAVAVISTGTVGVTWRPGTLPRAAMGATKTILGTGVVLLAPTAGAGTVGTVAVAVPWLPVGTVQVVVGTVLVAVVTLLRVAMVARPRGRVLGSTEALRRIPMGEGECRRCSNSSRSPRF